MISQRNPLIAALVVETLSGAEVPQEGCLAQVHECAERLDRGGFRKIAMFVEDCGCHSRSPKPRVKGARCEERQGEAMAKPTHTHQTMMVVF